MVHPARIHVLNARPTSPGKYVLYWMQASQRTVHNDALEHAIARGNALGLPVVVSFGVMDGYPEANARHYAFMLHGLADVAAGLAARGIAFALRHGPPPTVALALAAHAAEVICDRGYTTLQRRWRDQLADQSPCRVTQVEADVIVPVEVASDKHEYAARTLRPRITRALPPFLKPLRPTRPTHPSSHLKFPRTLDASRPAAILARLQLDRSVPPTPHFTGGQAVARQRLDTFIRHHLPGYASARNEPAAAATSRLSPYLHFGQISPVHIALAVQGAVAPPEDKVAYLEELIVRRELSANFCQYAPHYDAYAGALPAWAQKSLARHAPDPRPAIYTPAQLESAATADPYWNAAQTEMVRTGFMHNYMRMYWGKKFLEWLPTPQLAFEALLRLNNKYLLDGRGPNAFANVAWIFGTHDRPWGPERPIFGLIRYMNAAGLERKFDMEAYLKMVANLD